MCTCCSRNFDSKKKTEVFLEFKKDIDARTKMYVNNHFVDIVEIFV